MRLLETLLNNRGKRLGDLARALKVNKATVTRWNQNGVPPERLAEIEEATGIAACDLRPELASVFLKTREATQ